MKKMRKKGEKTLQEIGKTEDETLKQLRYWWKGF